MKSSSTAAIGMCFFFRKFTFHNKTNETHSKCILINGGEICDV